jgi:hypothetical protein
VPALGDPHPGPATLYATPDEAPRVLFQRHEPWVLFFDPQRNLHLLRVRTGEQTRITPEAGDGARHSFAGLYGQDGDIYVLWRSAYSQGPHRGERQLYFRAGRAGEPGLSETVRLDDSGGASHPKVSLSGGGGIQVAWMDSRSGPSHRLHFNRSLDGGRTWLPRAQRLDAAATGVYDPFLAASGSQVALGWTEGAGAARTLRLRRSRDGGGTWSEVESLPTGGDRPLTPEAVLTPQGLAVFYYADGAGIRLLRRGADDREWVGPVTLPGTQASGSTGFRVRASTRGDLCLVWPGPFRLGGRKADIYVACSNDAGLHWNAVARLNRNTPGHSQSLAPALGMDPEGRVVVAWQDLRTIRAGIFLNYSLDGGRHWQATDLPLTRPPGARHAQFPQVASDGADGFLVVWQHTGSDDPRGADYRVGRAEVRFACPARPGEPAGPCLEPREAPRHADRRERLVRRATAFWRSYVDGDFAQGFRLMDPFFRARTSAEQFASRVGQIDYSAFEVLDDAIGITENHAKVPVRVRFEARAFQVGDETGSIPPTETTVEDRWVWLDGDWFKVYTGRSGDFLPKI